MLNVYGPLMPLRMLEEIRFWKTQEREHTQVIRALTPNLEPEYVKLMEQWEAVLAKTEYTSQQLIEAVIRSSVGVSPYLHSQVIQLLNVSMVESQKFVNHLEHMLNHSAAIKGNPTAPVVVQHIIRESEYFLGVLQPFLQERAQPAPDRQQHPSPPAASSCEAMESTEALVSASAGSAGLDADSSRSATVGRSSELPSEEVTSATAEGVWSRPPVPDQKPVPIGGHTLPPLPYAYNALEPYIDEETMKLHHDIHHKAYVDGLNKAETMLRKSRETGDFDLVKHWEREAAFNGAGHYLHTIFWNVMNPKGGGKPDGALARQIDQDFGSYQAFHKQFSQAAEKVEGGGWAILVWSPRSHRLEILQAEKHQNLSQWDVIPLLALDVWEHAYYLKYKNERAKYIEAWWNLVYWPHVNERFSAARMLRWHPY